jgi:hypothetical protein
MDTKRCKKCGIPLLVSKTYKWKSNGTFGPGSVRSFWFEEDNLQYLLDDFKKHIGVSVEKLPMEGSRQGTIEYSKNIYRGWKRMLAIAFGPFLNLFPKFFENKYAEETKSVGWGRIMISELKWKKRLVLNTERAYVSSSFKAFIGSIQGAMEYFWGFPTKVSVREEGSKIKIVLEKAKERSEISSILKSPKIRIMPGSINYKLCPVCKTPFAVSDIFSWDWKDGFVLYKESGKKWIVFTFNFIMTMSALEQELGEKMHNIIMEAERDYIIKNFPFPDLLKEKNDLYSKLLDPYLWGALGWGNVIDFKKDNGVLTVKIGNPFYDSVVAGVICGIYEIVEKIESHVQWSQDINGHTVVVVTPK